MAQRFDPGFRISRMDGFVLISGLIGSLLCMEIEMWFGIAIVFIVGHFFLFCNVFRISRPLELTWAALFLLLLGSTIVFQKPGWFDSFALSVVMTVVVVVIQMLQPSYHGVGWKTINPKLPQWWQSQTAVDTE
ncbi:MAG: hypothetical protein HQL77_14005 [Magnetococcales bacterium]|nr:hypothetical protein [Magnetococcales bacterium]